MVCKLPWCTTNSLMHYRLAVILQLISIYERPILHPKLPQQILICLTVSLSRILLDEMIQPHDRISLRTFGAIALVSEPLTDQARLRCFHIIQDEHGLHDERITFLLGPTANENGAVLQSVVESSRSSEGLRTPDFLSDQKSGRMRPFYLKSWELVQDAAPSINENDTSLSLALFGARKRVM